MADAWTKVTRELYVELTVAEKQVGNSMQRSRMQTAIAALDKADWYRDFAVVVGQEGKQLASIGENAGHLVTALDLLINVANPDTTSFEAGSSASGALGGMLLVAAGLAMGMTGGWAIAGVGIAGAMVGKAFFENWVAPLLGLPSEGGPLFRDSAALSLEFLLKGVSDDPVRVTDEVYLLDLMRKVVLGVAAPTPRDNLELYFQNSHDLNKAIRDNHPNGLVVVPLTTLTLNEIRQLASQSGSLGDPYRYALRELHAAAVTGLDYASKNSDGSLDLSAQRADTNGMSEQYINDRAAMLYWFIQRNLANAAGPVSGGPGVQGARFRDVSLGVEFDLGLPEGVVEKRQTLGHRSFNRPQRSPSQV